MGRLIGLTTAAAVSVAVGVTIAGLSAHFHSAALTSKFATTDIRPVHVAESWSRRAQMTTTADDSFNATLRDPKFWAGRKSSRSSSDRDGRSNLGQSSIQPRPTIWRGTRADGDDENASQKGTYRTMCVRLCDGYFWPISFATSQYNFERDQQRCEASCTSDARLFRYQNPGEDFEDMQDLNGEPYKALRTAFKFRKTYDQACSCRPQPWEQASLERHKLYALERQMAKGDKAITTEISLLRAKVDAAHKKMAATPHNSNPPASPARRGKSAKKAPSNSDSNDPTATYTEPVSPAAPASRTTNDRVVMLRLGARSPIAVRVGSANPKRQDEDWRRRVIGPN